MHILFNIVLHYSDSQISLVKFKEFNIYLRKNKKLKHCMKNNPNR